MPTTFTDWVIVIGLPLAVIQTIYVALTYHSAKLSEATGGQPPASRRHLLIMGVLAVLSWGLFAADHFIPRTDIIVVDSVLGSWSYGDGVFNVDVHGEHLQNFKDDYVIVLYVKAFLPYVDRMQDAHGIKSVGYSIQNNEMRISTSVTKDFCSLLSNTQATNVEEDVVLLPKKFSPEQISSLSALEMMGGKVIAHPGHARGIHQSAGNFVKALACLSEMGDPTARAPRRASRPARAA